MPTSGSKANEQRPSDTLPEGWIAVNELNEDGVVEHYTNIVTKQTFYTKEDLFRYAAYAGQANLEVVGPNQPDQARCARCKCTEHITSECNFSEAVLRGIKSLYEPPLCRRGESNQKSSYRCSRCGRYGHNIRTCHGPIVKF